MESLRSVCACDRQATEGFLMVKSVGYNISLNFVEGVICHIKNLKNSVSHFLFLKLVTCLTIQ